MPTIVHERFIAQIVEEIQVQLKSVTGESAQFANKIGSYGSASITFPDQEYGKHDPDADIRVVIGLDIEYRGSKKATLSEWRPNVITNDIGEKELVAEQIVTNQVFCHSNGDPGKSPIGGLQLRLRDFTTAALAEGRPRDPIDISAATLCTFLEHAEKRASFIKRRSSVVSSAKPWNQGDEGGTGLCYGAVRFTAPPPLVEFKIVNAAAFRIGVAMVPEFVQVVL